MKFYVPYLAAPCAVAVLLAAPVRVNAAPQTETVSADAAVTTGSPGTISLPQFNSSLGTLESISLAGSEARLNTANLDVINIDPSPESGTADVSQGIQVDYPNSTQLFTLSQSQTGVPYSVGAAPAGGFSQDNVSVTLAEGTAGPVVLTDPADLATFTGGGVVSLSAGPVSASFSGVSPAGVFFGGLGQNENVTVTAAYTYLAPAVPEPGVMSLAASGVVGAFWRHAARRRGRAGRRRAR